MFNKTLAELFPTEEKCCEILKALNLSSRVKKNIKALGRTNNPNISDVILKDGNKK